MIVHPSKIPISLLGIDLFFTFKTIIFRDFHNYDWNQGVTYNKRKFRGFYRLGQTLAPLYHTPFLALALDWNPSGGSSASPSAAFTWYNGLSLSLSRCLRFLRLWYIFFWSVIVGVLRFPRSAFCSDIIGFLPSLVFLGGFCFSVVFNVFFFRAISSVFRSVRVFFAFLFMLKCC